ncbi:uncharacterized protein LOC114357144 [Ostrinia furnacalis]|uniref:uncharacterized protein LOC114357144 n=1 Tax=Ostrinia furnacalis TaxID=93504 RepID=UPI00103D316D|nr:uncharacterized protein LOC114357144 [Ostrinia furnacalis]
MLVACGLMLLLSSVRCGNIESNGLILGKGFDGSVSYSYWPSMLHATNMMRIRKRELQTEGGSVKVEAPPPAESAAQPAASDSVPAAPQSVASDQAPNSQPEHAAPSPQIPDTKPKKDDQPPAKPDEVKNNDTPKVDNPNDHTLVNSSSTAETSIETAKNKSSSNEDKVELGPGFVKRGVIVFGGFALLAVAYFIFYRRKSSKNESNNSHNAIDANQFRYGVLQSEDRRDNLELSRIPLTMESDEDDDDYLEIFDLEQKKKSMSYVNLQVNDEEVVNGPKDNADGNDRDNLLLDIEDSNYDPLINWSGNGNKSIL